MKISRLMQDSGVSFGTSGARGLVSDMTDQVCFAYVQGFLSYLGTIGEFKSGKEVALAGDLRPSSPRILQACIAAIEFSGGKPVFCGYIPTPALSYYAYAKKIPSLMVTGSHIPADRNGIKFNRAEGEFLKSDEVKMGEQDIAIPSHLFDQAGNLLEVPMLPEPLSVEEEYIKRYKFFFGEKALSGMNVGVYQHSAVGRDILTKIISSLGGKALPFGRSDSFVSVDTEAVREEDVAIAHHWASENAVDAIITTDGDSDRPLMADEHGKWLRGDLLGILAVECLEAKGVATPISSNTALEDKHPNISIERTKIGSPYVIEAMNTLIEQEVSPAVGYEANGGFLLGTPVYRKGKKLEKLPTRDSVLPILCALAASQNSDKSLSALVGDLPNKYTASDRIKDVPTAFSKKKLASLRDDISSGMKELGFLDLCGNVKSLNEVDGIRVTFDSGDIVHLRPSGNAPELRLYIESYSEERVQFLLSNGLQFLSRWKNEL
ncbi:phosphomannomutase [Bombella sp. ESL0387]|nr:phosphomannomutase [Bombella sp. ESL0387]